MFMDTPPELSVYQAQEGDKPPPDAFDATLANRTFVRGHGIEATPADVDLLATEMVVGPEGSIAFATFASHMARLRA